MNKMELDMKTILGRRDDIQKKIARVKNPSAYRDLRDWVSRVDDQISELSREGVVCRQTKRITPKYEQIAANIDAMMYNIEKHTTYAVLKSKE